ncbi:Mor transcription activator family protein [Roseicyclus amphidinii]|uniref:Mor transcription activator family protein n=1 Tax=Roseicyclus amphidinii TaxID=3034232 RepID=UPI0024E19326|nr:Mor transcription activator family protein [Roseicyclus sp. Amp-Y-6]
MLDLDGPLPESVATVAEVIGRDAALRLVAALPASPGKPWQAAVYIPSEPRLRPGHQLVAILGWEVAAQLCRGLGGEMFFLSKCRELHRAHRNRRIWELRAEGLTAGQIGARIGMSADTVRKILQRRAGGNPHMETANRSAANC